MPQIFEPSHHPKWSLLATDFALSAADAISLAQKLPKESGIYLWTICHNETEHALYIGKAALLSRRIYNYAQSFQPHSPNDRKLYFAQEALRQMKPGAKFPLYWKQVSATDLNEAELDAIRNLKPVMNNRSRYSPEHRARLADAYSALYSELIATHFGEG
jgi:hypothetical protein